MLGKTLNKLIKKTQISSSFGAKMLSIIFAIILWIFVMDQVNPEITKTFENVSVNLLNEERISEKGLEIMGTKEFYVNVKVKGRRNEVLNVKNSDISITADLGSATKGNNAIRLEQKLYKENVVIEELAQAEINIFLDEIIEENRPIRIEYSGNVPNNFSLDKITLYPKEVTIKGPETIVSMVKRVVGVLDLEEIKTDTTKRVKIRALDENGQVVGGISLGRDYIEVILSVNKVKSVRIEPLLVGKVAEGFKIVKAEVSPSVVAIQSKEDGIKEITQMLTKEINVNNLSETKEFKIELVILSGVETPYLTGEVTVTVEIEKLQSKDFVFEPSEITFLNVPKKQSIEVSEGLDKVNVKFVDVESILSDLTKSDIEIYIDGSNLKVGKNRVNILYKTRNRYEKISIIPEFIDVNVLETDEVGSQSESTQEDESARGVVSTPVSTSGEINAESEG
jgi:YbbR domain-containing protein